MTDWVNLNGLAEWFGWSKKTLRRKLPGLYAMEFPQPVLGKWYLPACKEWAGDTDNADRRYRSADPLMEALDGQRLN